MPSTLNEMIAESLLTDPPTTDMGCGYAPELPVYDVVDQLRKPVEAVLPEDADEADIVAKLTEMEAGSKGVKSGVVSSVVERVGKICVDSGRIDPSVDLDVGNVWDAWASVLSGAALAEHDESSLRTATLDDVVDALNSKANVLFIGKGGKLVII